MAVAFCSVMLDLGGIEVVSTGETHHIDQEKVTSMQISLKKKSGHQWKYGREKK